MSAKLFGIELGQLGISFKQLKDRLAALVFFLLPKKIQDKVALSPEYISIEPISDHRIKLIKYQKASESILGEFDITNDILELDAVKTIKAHLNDDVSLCLFLPSNQVLVKEVIFPVAVESNLRQTVYYSLDKYTPFNKDELFYDVHVVQKTATNLVVKLVIAHKNILLPLLTVLSKVGLKPDQVCVKDYLDVNLLPLAMRRKRRLFHFGRNAFLLVLILFLSLLILALPLYFKRQTVLDLGREIDALASVVGDESSLISMRDTKLSMVNHFIVNKPVDFVMVFEDLSKRLNDDTWLTNFIYINGRFSIRGESTDAAALVNELSRAPIYQDVQLESSIIRSTATGREVFKIGFRVIGSGQEVLDEL